MILNSGLCINPACSRFSHTHFVEYSWSWCLSPNIDDVYCITIASVFFHRHVFKLIAGKCFDPEFVCVYEYGVWSIFSHNHFVKSSSRWCFSPDKGDVYCILATSGISHNHIFKLIAGRCYDPELGCVRVLSDPYFLTHILSYHRQVNAVVRIMGTCVATGLPQFFLTNMFSN